MKLDPKRYRTAFPVFAAVVVGLMISKSFARGDSASAATDSPPKLVIITNGFAAFWDSMNKGRMDAAHRFKVDTDWEGPPHAQVAEQRELMEQAADKGFNGMAVSAVDAIAIAPVIDKVTSHGMKVITFDNDVPRSKRLLFIGTDNYKAGQRAGQQMVRLLPRGGKVWGFVGAPLALNARERIAGFRSAVAGHHIAVVGIVEDRRDPFQAQHSAENILQSRGAGVKGMVGFYSYETSAIVTALRRAHLRRRVKVVGFDAEPDTLRGLQQGKVDAAIVQNPYEMGYLSVQFLYLVQRDGLVKARAEWNTLNPSYPIHNDRIDTGIQVVTPYNLAPFLQQLQVWGVRSS